MSDPKPTPPGPQDLSGTDLEMVHPAAPDFFSRSLGNSPPQPQDSSKPFPPSETDGPKNDGSLHSDLDMDALLLKYPKPQSLEDDARGHNPEESAGLLSFLFMSYLDPLISLGKKRPLLEQDVPSLAKRDNVAKCEAKLRGHWEAQLRKAEAANRETHSRSDGREEPSKPGQDGDAGTPKPNKKSKKTKKKKQPSFFKAVQAYWKWSLAFVLAAQSISRAGIVVTPIIVGEFLDWLVNYQAGVTTDVQEGWEWAAILFSIPLFTVFTDAHTDHVLSRAVGQIKSAVQGLVFRKMLLTNTSFTTEADSKADEGKSKDKEEKEKLDSEPVSPSKDDSSESPTGKQKKDETPKEDVGSTGQVTNLMASDTDQISMMVREIPNFVLAPFQIGVILWLLYDTIGSAAFIGFATLVIFGPLVGGLMALMGGTMMRSKIHADYRIKIVNEILQGIQIVKFYAWEKSFMSSVADIRSKELKEIRWMNFYISMVMSFFSFMPITVTLASIGSYTALGNDLTVVVVFKTLSLFHAISQPLMELPQGIAMVALGAIACGRIQRFLESPELQKDNVVVNQVNPPPAPQDSDEQKQPAEKDDFAVEIVNAVFSYQTPKAENEEDPETSAGEADTADSEGVEGEDGKGDAKPPSQDEEIVLRDINFRARRGKLTAIIGKVGSGKSSILRTLLGETYLLEGSVHLNFAASEQLPRQPRPPGDYFGTHTLLPQIGYVSQRAWIQNATIEENILFGRHRISGRYEDTIRVCALEPDLEILPGGEKCGVGDRGLTLSGGQQQRLACARSLYSGGEIQLLDDPLSAVDAHVADTMFRDCIRGAMANTTRIFVTNQLQLLPKTDYIYLMDQGRIAQEGTYEELIQTPQFLALVESNRQQLNRRAVDQCPEAVPVEDQPEEAVDEGEQKSRVADDGALDPAAVNQLIRQASRPSSSQPHQDHVSEAPEQPKQPPPKLLTETQIEALAQQTVEEELYTGSVSWGTYLVHLQSMGSTWLLVLLIIVLFLSPGISTMSSFLLSWWSQDEFDRSHSFYLMIYAMIAVGSALGGLTRGIIFAICSARAAQAHHDNLFQSVMRATMGFFDMTPTGRILTRFSKDALTVDYEVPSSLSMGMSLIATVVVSLIATVFIVPYFIIAVVFAGLMLFWIQRYSKAAIVQLQRLESRSSSPVISHFTESMMGLETVRAFGAQHRFRSDNRDKVQEAARMAFVFHNCLRWANLRIGLLQSTLVMFLGLFLVVQREDINSGHAGAALDFVTSMASLLGFLMYILTSLESSMNSVERIRHYAHHVPPEPVWDLEDVHAAHHKTVVASEYEAVVAVQSGREDGEEEPWIEVPEDWPSKGEIRIENAVMSYRAGLEPALRGVDLVIPGGSKVGIAGRTGSGKSTLMLCLFRLYELDSGRILIDGLDISRIPLHTLRGRLCLVPQDPVCFAGTLRSNLDPFEQFSDEEIWKSLEASGLKAWATEKSDSLEYKVKEFGSNLSQGQRQQLCLARAVLRRPNLLLLDEATSAMDQGTDAQLQETLTREFSNSTVLTIAHRLNTIMHSDQIVLLRSGQVKEVGSPQDLLEKPDGEFSSMHRAMVAEVS